MPDIPFPGTISTMDLVAKGCVTYRQVDYWSRARLLRPRILREAGRGQGGVSRWWDAEEQRVARLMGRLTAAGIMPRIAERVARSPQGRYEAGPGVWIQVDEEVPTPSPSATPAPSRASAT